MKYILSDIYRSSNKKHLFKEKDDGGWMSDCSGAHIPPFIWLHPVVVNEQEIHRPYALTNLIFL